MIDQEIEIKVLSKGLYKTIDRSKGIKKVKELIDLGADVNYFDKTEGMSVLMKAVLMNHGDEVKALLLAGANPDIGDNAGNTPLMLAVEKNLKYIVRILVDYKADPKKKNKKGQTALDDDIDTDHFLKSYVNTKKLGSYKKFLNL